METNYNIGILRKTRIFDSIAESSSLNNWDFRYITRTQDGRDATLYPNLPLMDKSNYEANTIFLDSEQDIFTLDSSIKNVYIDKSEIIKLNANIQAVAIIKDRIITVTFESKTAIDVKNFTISCGDPTDGGEILYGISRNKPYDEQIDTGIVYDISISKYDNAYTVKFYMDIDYSCEKLNQNQLYIHIWNIAGNQLLYHTPEDTVWKAIQSDYQITDLSPLRIIFTDADPESRIVDINHEGSVKVQIQNPNIDFYELIPYVELDNTSIGVIDETSMSYDSYTGVLSFIVNNITETGYVIINTYLAIDNDELAAALKNATYASGMDGQWFGTTVGRKIRFDQNVPKYLKNENYAAFTQMTQDFMNTMYTSLSHDSTYISILEKIARVNNFNNIKALETSLLNEYKKQYNIIFDPNLDTYKEFLEHKLVEKPLPDTNNDGKIISNIPSAKMAKAAPINLMALNDADNMDDNNIPIVDEVLQSTMKNFIFQDLTGDELYSFLTDMYRNIPYYNQLSGTYRGITFILDQLGLCVKLIEIWASRNIKDNFSHDQIMVREDQINAVHHVHDNTVADIGRYYLTSRFDVDVLESGLTYEEFNNFAFTIVKLILNIKPIHRVLRKLAYVFVGNTNLHEEHILLHNTSNDLSNDNYYYKEIRRYNYTWNLFDKYSVKKSLINVIDDTLVADSLFIPFNAVNANVKFNRDNYNLFGEYKLSSITGENKKFQFGKYKGEEKPIGTRVVPPGLTDYIPAVKNSFHNLCNFENKLDKSFVKSLRIKFLYIEQIIDENNVKTINAFVKNDNYESLPKILFSSTDADTQFEANTFDPIALTYQTSDGISISTHNFIDYLVNMPELWTEYNFNLLSNLTIKSATNGFYMELNNVSKTILNELGVKTTYNTQYTLDPSHDLDIKINDFNQNSDTQITWSGNISNQLPNRVITPVCLLCKIDDLGIPLGTKYITQLDKEDEPEPLPPEPICHINDTTITYKLNPEKYTVSIDISNMYADNENLNYSLKIDNEG